MKLIIEKEKLIKCECPERANAVGAEHLYSEEEKSGMNHEPNQCLGTNNIRKFKRGSRELYLCSCCFLSGDEKIELNK